MIWTVIQARTRSTRRPGKVLAEFPGGPTMLDAVYKRATMIGPPVALAIPDNDPELERLCMERDWQYVVGSEEDVLARYVKAADELDASHIIRVTADCPFLDPESARSTLAWHLETGADLTWDEAEGRGVQVFEAAALEHADKFAFPYERHSPDVAILHRPFKFHIEVMSFSVDTPEDLELARRRALCQYQQ